MFAKTIMCHINKNVLHKKYLRDSEFISVDKIHTNQALMDWLKTKNINTPCNNYSEFLIFIFNSWHRITVLIPFYNK